KPPHQKDCNDQEDNRSSENVDVSKELAVIRRADLCTNRRGRQLLRKRTRNGRCNVDSDSSALWIVPMIEYAQRQFDVSADRFSVPCPRRHHIVRRTSSV